MRLVDKLPDKVTIEKNEKDGRSLWFVITGPEGEVMYESEFLNDLINLVRKDGKKPRECDIEPEWR